MQAWPAEAWEAVLAWWVSGTQQGAISSSDQEGALRASLGCRPKVSPNKNDVKKTNPTCVDCRLLRERGLLSGCLGCLCPALHRLEGLFQDLRGVRSARGQPGTWSVAAQSHSASQLPQPPRTQQEKPPPQSLGVFFGGECTWP